LKDGDGLFNISIGILNYSLEPRCITTKTRRYEHFSI